MRTPGFWSDKNSLYGKLLSPLGALYGAATRRRLAKGRRYRAPIPIICVGNVTAGGSGKTPVVQALVQQALARGIAVHCLSRGYGGHLPGPVRVDPGLHTAADVGDEPLLLAASAPCWVSRDREAGVKQAVAAGAKLLILDDGLQNPALDYDLALLVIDGGFGFGNGRLIPAGPLRELVADAAARVGAVIVIGEDRNHCWAGLPSSLPTITARIVPKANNLAGQRIVAFAGLGRPDKFRRTLEDLGAVVVDWFPFPDHHVFARGELDRLEKAARDASAILVTTEKDFVRLPVEFRGKVTALGIELAPDDGAAFDRLLDGVTA